MDIIISYNIHQNAHNCNLKKSQILKTQSHEIYTKIHQNCIIFDENYVAESS